MRKPNKDSSKAELFHDKAVYRDNDHAALAMMKELERKRRKKLISIKTPDKTIFTSTKERIKELGIEGVRI